MKWLTDAVLGSVLLMTITALYFIIVASWAPPVQSVPECNLNPELLASIRTDLYAWMDKGFTVGAMRNRSKMCPESHNDPTFCSNKYISVTIDKGQLYFNNLIPRVKDRRPWVEAPGQLLELLETTLKYPNLPNVDLTFAFGDELSGLPSYVLTAVLTSFKGNDHKSAILIPNSGHYRCVRDSVESLSAIPDVLTQHPWEDKKDVAFGRFMKACPFYCHNEDLRFRNGSNFECPRESLEALSLQNNKTELDVVLNADGLPLLNQTYWKYLLSTDGWSCSNRLDKMLVLGSVVLKQWSQRYGWYYAALKPYKHYVPFFSDNSSDILQVVKWLRENDDIALEISREAKKFATEVLFRSARLCYWKTLIEEYAKFQRYRPSCRLHKMCVPALKELDYLGYFEPLGSAAKCTIHKQLDEMYGQPLDHGTNIWGHDFGGNGSMHGYDGWYFHEDESLDLLDGEVVHNWKPPAWTTRFKPLSRAQLTLEPWDGQGPLPWVKMTGDDGLNFTKQVARSITLHLWARSKLGRLGAQLFRREERRNEKEERGEVTKGEAWKAKQTKSNT